MSLNAETRPHPVLAPAVLEAALPHSAHRVGEQHTLKNFTQVQHFFEVPLRYSDPAGEKIQVFAREYRLTEGGEEKPWLVFLQGGPGGRGNRYQSRSGWFKAATEHYRLLMLDQRGTGLSTPFHAERSRARGDLQQQLEYALAMRTDSIIADAETIRRLLGVEQWTTLGQSYGGFLTAAYLSFAPQALIGCMVTGGIPPLAHTVEQVYGLTYAAVRRRWEEFLSWYPEDAAVWDRVMHRVRESQELFGNGRRVQAEHVQRLGMMLGGNTRVHQLHYLLEEAFDGDRLSEAFKQAVWGQFSQEASPWYGVGHEQIYGVPGEAIDWAAWRMLEQNPDFSPSAEVPLPTGEMIYPSHMRLDPAMEQIRELAEALSAHTEWNPVYDLDQLGRNTVPVAACMYSDDIYVTKEASLAAAERIARLEIYERSDLHHDGIAEDGEKIFEELRRRIAR